MANAAIMVSWTRAFPGREGIALSKFGEYVGYLTTLQNEKRIESFEPVIVRPNGSALGGYFLIRGDRATLDSVTTTDGWKDWEVWGAFNLAGFAISDCQLGANLQDMLGRWGKLVGS